MLEVAATTPSNPLVGGRVVDISLLTNDAAGSKWAASRIAAGTPVTRAARPNAVTLFYTPIERAIPKRCFAIPVAALQTAEEQDRCSDPVGARQAARRASRDRPLYWM